MNKFDVSLLTDDVADQYIWTWMNVRTDPLSAEDYHAFAVTEINHGKSPRHLVNALANAKKALHLRLEDICLGFGAVELKKLRTFPALIKYARDCGFAAPRVLDRLNMLRNAVEHDFKVPLESEVETFVDVVHLFIAVTDRWISRQPIEVSCYNLTVTHNYAEFELRRLVFDWSKGSVLLIFEKSFEGMNSSFKIEYRSPSREFFHCVRFAIRNSD